MILSIFFCFSFFRVSSNNLSSIFIHTFATDSVIPNVPLKLKALALHDVTVSGIVFSNIRTPLLLEIQHCLIVEKLNYI